MAATLNPVTKLPRPSRRICEHSICEEVHRGQRQMKTTAFMPTIMSYSKVLAWTDYQNLLWISPFFALLIVFCNAIASPAKCRSKQSNERKWDFVPLEEPLMRLWFAVCRRIVDRGHWTVDVAHAHSSKPYATVCRYGYVGIYGRVSRAEITH